MPRTFIRSLKLKIRSESYSWLCSAATEVNQVFNFCNATSHAASSRTDRKRKWMSGFDLCALTAGATEYFDRIGSETIQCVCLEYANKRIASSRSKLRWRVSKGVRRSLGWIPFKEKGLKRKGSHLRFCGKTFRVFERERLKDVKWRAGCFAQDAIGDWWLCLKFEAQEEQSIAPKEAVGIDLGLKDVAVTSDGERFSSGRFFRESQHRLAELQRRGHRRQAKRLHRKIRRRREDAFHKFSHHIVRTYQKVIVGDVSSTKLAKTRMAKAVFDSGWGMLKRMLQYKGEHAGRSVKVVSERNTTRACSSCGALSGPSGLRHLVVRQWTCANCGESHDRDVNAARNMLTVGSRCRTSVRGNEQSPSVHLACPTSELRILATGCPEGGMTTG